MLAVATAIALGAGTMSQLDESVWFLHPGAEDSAGPMIFETTSDQHHAIRKQGRGQAIAGMSPIVAAVECEPEAPLPIDPSAFRRPATL